MPTVVVPGGTLSFRAAGPAEAPRPVVFAHGALVNGELWTGVADALAARGVRSYAPDLPLGAHTIALDPDADRTPRGVARMLIAFLEALQLDDVTLVGNDTGGAISQFLIDADPARIGRLVLTNCDAFDTFPPQPFDLMFKAGRHPASLRAMVEPMRATAVRHSMLGFGMLVATPPDPALTRRWIDPVLTDAGVRRDTAALFRAIDKRELLDVSTRLSRFDRPVLLPWGAADRFFRLELARRLQGAFPDARLIELAGGRTFHPLDDPDRLATEIAVSFYANAAVSRP